jgi:hypothetical protein
MAEEIAGQVRRLNGFVDGTLQGGYVQSLAKAAEGLKDDLGLTGRRYREVGGALQGWAPQLTGFQDEAERLRLVAVTAQGAMSDNQAVPQLRAVDAAPPPEAQVAAANARQGRYEDAGGDLSRAQGRLAELVGRRDAAAARVADAIRESCDDGVANSAWDSFQDWMDDHHELVSGICDVLGVIAIAVCVVALVVPGLNVLAAGVLIAATSASLVGHTMLASTGHGSWGAVAVDVVNLATLGAASLAVRLFTEAGALVRGAAALKAAEKVATAANTAEGAADAALAAGRTTGAAAELSVGGEVFTDVSTGGAPRVLIPAVQDALDAVPAAQRAPWHGACAEMGCLSQAFDAGVNPAGGSIRAVAIGSSNPGHGLPKMICSSCSSVLDRIGVTR